MHPTSAAASSQAAPGRAIPDLGWWGAKDLERLLRRLRDSIAHLGDTAPGRALRRLVQVIADRSQFRDSNPGMALVEVSLGFLASGAEVGINAARAAFAAFRSATVEFVLDEASATRCGWLLRPLLPGTRRGPLRTYPAEAIAACRLLADELDEEGWIGGPLRGVWRVLDSGELRDLGFLPLPAGRKVCCPVHEDHDPSLVVLGDPSGPCGPGFCHGGCGALFWSRAVDGSRWVRQARREPGMRSSIASHPESEPPTEDGGHPPGSPSRPRRVVRGEPGAVLSGEALRRALGPAEGHVGADLGRGGLRRRWARDVIEALAWADVAGPVAEREIGEAGALVARGLAEAASVAPSRFLSVGAMRPTSVELRRLPGVDPAAGLALAVPIGFEPGQQGWVLVDLDDLEPALGWRGAEAVGLVGEVAEGDARCSGRVALVETSPGGVQAWVELRDPVVDPRSWWRRAEVRGWYGRLSSAVLDAVRRSGRTGGFVDPSAASAGRYGRRPGWRLVDGWVPFRCRLLGLSEPMVTEEPLLSWAPNSAQVRRSPGPASDGIVTAGGYDSLVVRSRKVLSPTELRRRLRDPG